MGCLSLETRSKVTVMKKNGYPVPEIQERLSQGVTASKVSLYALVKKYDATNLVDDLERKPRRSLLDACHYRFIDETMTEDNELTSRQLLVLFTDKFPAVEISISTLMRASRHLGWISKKTRYCALICEEN